MGSHGLTRVTQLTANHTAKVPLPMPTETSTPENGRPAISTAVKQSHLNLEYADDSLKADRSVMLAAVMQDGDVLELASEELQQDEELKKIAEG